MALISELVTELVLKTDKFDRGVKSALSSVSGFAAKATPALLGVAAVVSGALAASFVGLISIINSTTDEISNLVDVSERISVPVAKLQALKYAAEQSGIGFNQITKAAQNLQKNLGAALDGNKAKLQAFKDLGINIELFKSKDITEQFNEISTALRSIQNPAQQAQAAFTIFGASSKQVLGLLRSNLSSTFAEFSKFGSALTDEQAQAVDSYGDSVNRLSQYWDGFTFQLTASVAPALQSIIQWIEAFIQKSGGMGPVAKQAAELIIGGIQSMVNGFQGLLNFIDSVIIAIDTLRLNATKLISDFKNLKFELGSGDFDFAGSDKIAQLTKEIKQRKKDIATNSATSSLQKGLAEARANINKTTTTTQNQKQEIKLDVRVDKQGVVQIVVDSPEMKGNINKIIQETVQNEASSTGF
jgi:hypothetical protein